MRQVMFQSAIDNIEPDRVTLYRISSDGQPATYATVLDLWQCDSGFRSYFTTLLADSPFSAYRWETPPVTHSSVNRPFEFVLINSPGFSSRKTDATTYAQYFTDDDADAGVVTFTNLRGDATLIVPSPRTTDAVYGHLAAFIRNAPHAQVDSIWRVISKQVRSRLGSKPVWLSTAGGGVAWLHVRLDSRPKYYGHQPYRTA